MNESIAGINLLFLFSLMLKVNLKCCTITGDEVMVGRLNDGLCKLRPEGQC